MIGTGLIGGKACGMLLSRKIVQNRDAELFEREILRSPYPDTLPQAPDPELTEEQEETLQDTADGLKEKASTYLKQLRLVADSPDAVMVYAYLSVDGRVLASSVCDE